jgi:hypothetical protein
MPFPAPPALFKMLAAQHDLTPSWITSLSLLVHAHSILTFEREKKTAQGEHRGALRLYRRSQSEIEK